MASLLSAARPYANAAFSVAKADNQLPLWSQALKQLSLIVEDAEVKSIIDNPNYTKPQLNTLFLSFLETKAVTIQNFISLLIEKKRLSLLPDVATLFEKCVAAESGYTALTVISASDMDAAERLAVTEKLSRQLKTTVVIDFQVDASLIGGLFVRSDNWVLDDTIKGKLTRLKSALV